MTLTLELPPEVESALAEDARHHGTTPEQFVLDSLRQKYAAQGVPKPDNAMLALFAQWDAEDATDDPEELARRQREGDELMANLAANRMNFEGRTDFRALLGDDTEDDGEENVPQEKAA